MPFPPLVDDPDGILALPEGFRYAVVTRTGVTRLDGGQGLTLGGPTYAIARNQLNDSEFCGPTFSADGKVLFVNMQDPGLTLAITGPWEKYLG